MDAEQLIIENIDLWTSAIKAKTGQGRGSNKKIELYGIKKLRELILELAVHGKLVPQDPNDEPASVLMERVAAEKKLLVKEKKIKKSNNLPDISKDDNLFALPSGWEWARLENIGHDWGQKKPDGEFTYIDVGAINKEFGFVQEPTILSASIAPSRARKLVKPGTVIYSTIRPYLLNIAVIDKEFAPEPIASTAFAVLHPYTGLSSKFIYYFLRSPVFTSYVDGCQAGIAYPAINDKQFFSGLIPIPPTLEQKKIVAKVDRLMALCDQLEQQTEASLDASQLLIETLLDSLTTAKDASEFSENWARLSEHFDTLITTDYAVEQLKQTILQLAVMGKLIPQDPSDEPASELLKRIAAEKEQLIKDKKIKRKKPLPKITEEEKPFSLPKGWEWSRIGEASLSTDYGLSDKSEPDIEGVPVLTMGHIQSGQVVLKNMKSVSLAADSLPELLLKSRDLLYNRTNSAELVGKTGIFVGDDDSYTFASYLIRIRTVKNTLLPEFININMQSSSFRKTQINPHLKQQCGQANVNGTTMNNMLISVAPPQEIERIVLKVKQLITICDQLKEKLKRANNTQYHFAETATKANFN